MEAEEAQGRSGGQEGLAEARLVPGAVHGFGGFDGHRLPAQSL